MHSGTATNLNRKEQSQMPSKFIRRNNTLYMNIRVAKVTSVYAKYAIQSVALINVLTRNEHSAIVINEFADVSWVSTVQTIFALSHFIRFFCSLIFLLHDNRYWGP